METFGGVHAVWANQVRALHHMSIGQLERAESYQRLVELGAIQLGTVWQVESWAAAVYGALLLDDASAMKRAAEELSRLAQDVPTFAVFARWWRAAYLVLRERYEEALALYEEEDRTLRLLYAGPALSWFARAHNGLGQHERARELCTRALEQLGPDDRHVLSHSLRLEVELAVAEVALGDVRSGHARLDALIERHTPQTGPLVRGFLNLARARLHFLQGKLDEYGQSLDAAEALWAPLRIACLMETLAAMRMAAARPAQGPQLVPVLGGKDDSHLLTRVHVYLSARTETEEGQRYQKALRLAIELTQAERAFILPASGAGLEGMGGAIVPEVLRWAESKLLDAQAEEHTEVLEGLGRSVSTDDDDGALLEFAGVQYRAECLLGPTGAPLAALVWGATTGAPRNLPGNVISIIAEYLSRLSTTAATAGAAE
jgi:tetratricopeptide (TPR) repeat protein